eukprot:CAMPEP_0201281202 /NCGR_PEP_ID=MMETSP1317-20130820/1933_1 /ASSEMBLY_ACC=CAM_ASM_000770 /TAXON_ID=187299 /ORGANISM="Undescribed Undescribed, Strain Undescribed" /LENGTH=129 /DNA_ID=CAMNT_0047590487 /DNA_START=1 /DNA_END=390 /DNA_ORIENTATION=-
MMVKSIIVTAVTLIIMLTSLVALLIALFTAENYTQALVCIYCCLVLILVAAVDVSPSCYDNYLDGRLNFMKTRVGRGIVLILVATLMFGAEMHVFGEVMGGILAFVGLVNVIYGLFFGTEEQADPAYQP